MFRLCIAAALAVVAAAGNARVAGKRTLVLVDDLGMQKSHASFFSSLTDLGMELTVKGVDQDSDIVVQEFGEWHYDNIVLFAPEAEEFGTLDVDDLKAFVEGGGNVIVGVDSAVGASIREFAAVSGVDFDREGVVVIDHWGFDEKHDEGDHTLVSTWGYAPAPSVVGSLASDSSRPVVFQGVAQHVASDNVLAVKTLTASATAYAADPEQPVGDAPASAGTDTVLVTSIQGRNNARVTFLGSLFMCSDEAYTMGAQPAGQARVENANEEFCSTVAAWTFQHRGVLRASNPRHARADGSLPDPALAAADRSDHPRSVYPEPEAARDSLTYRIKDDIVYNLDVHEYKDGAWVPYAADDVQLEFIMLDPYVRTTMSHNGDGTFTGQFLAPDAYGVFKFRVMYRRPGMSVLDVQENVILRPFHHNEYERFIANAYPYYTAAFASMAGFVLFGFVFLYHKD
jgi:oligosaccharyltransferase complex subunit beta